MGEKIRAVVEALAAPLMVVIALGGIFYVFSLMKVDIEPILSIVVALTPIWLPVILFYLMFDRWQEFSRTKFAYENGRVTLRIKLPQEVLKSPEAMESVFSQIHNPNNSDNLWQAYIDGKHPLISSFEIASIGGEVRFYVNVPRKKIKNAIESQLYAQYPGVEVIEEPIDYAGEVVWDEDKWEMMSFHICKKKDDIYPIKTYIDFKLDMMPKEELKFEPMAPLLEHLGRVKPHERIWVQILAKPHAEQNFYSGSRETTSTWEKEAARKINEIMGRDDKRMAPEESENRPTLTSQERDTVAAIERNVSKYAYETAIRAMYITEKGKFDGDMIGPLLKSFSQYDIIGRNAMGVRWRTDFDNNWWSDYSGVKKKAMKQRELEAYKARSYDDEDTKTHIDRPKVMSAEELATIYHLPGTSIVTPGVTRIESSRREAPSNLPIQR